MTPDFTPIDVLGLSRPEFEDRLKQAKEKIDKVATELDLFYKASDKELGEVIKELRGAARTLRQLKRQS